MVPVLTLSVKVIPPRERFINCERGSRECKSCSGGGQITNEYADIRVSLETRGDVLPLAAWRTTTVEGDRSMLFIAI